MADFAAQLWDVVLCERVRTIAAVVGALYLLRKILGTLSFLVPFIKAYYLAPWGIFRTNLKKYGSWAVVTGASEGIGKGYAMELARRGLNVVIMSRSQEKLEKVADEIKDKYSVEVKVIPVDFSSGLEIYPQLSQQLENLDIGVLVNNVGLSYEHAAYFLEVPPERLRNVIEVNCNSMIQMTHVILDTMLKKKGSSAQRGVIINLSSTSAYVPMPLLTVYSASKAFVTYFSEGLRQEYASKGIVVQNIMPSLVVSSMSGIKKARLMVPTPTTFARSALNTVGHFNSTSGYVPHVLQEILLSQLPRCLSISLSMKMFKSVRQKALKRKARQKRED